MSTQTIFEPEAQAVIDLGQPKQNAIDFPQTLAERYQPKQLADFVDLHYPKSILVPLLKRPKRCALLFMGPPGCGKTAMATTFAEQLPGSLHLVTAQKCDVAALDALTMKFAYCPPKGNFWICQVEEADQMTDKAQLQLLSRLDGSAALRPNFGGAFERGAPEPVIWIFTCNGLGPEQVEPPYSLLPRFLSRCMRVPFAAVKHAELVSYLRKLWKAEKGPKTPDDYFEYIAEGVGVRDALMRLDVDLLAGPRPRPQPQPAPARVTVMQPRDVQALLTMRSDAARKAWATRRAQGWRPK